MLQAGSRPVTQPGRRYVSSTDPLTPCCSCTLSITTPTLAEGSYEITLRSDFYHRCQELPVLAELKDDAALPYIEKLRPYFPGEAEAIRARLLLRKGQTDEAATALEAALRSYQSDPWPAFKVMQRALRLAVEMSRSSPPLAGSR